MRELNFGCKILTEEQQHTLIDSLEESRKLRKKKLPNWREIRDFLLWVEVRIIAVSSINQVYNGSCYVDWDEKVGSAVFQLTPKGKEEAEKYREGDLEN